MRISPAMFFRESSAVATGIGFFVSPERAAGAQAQLGLGADTSSGSALPIRSFPADNFFQIFCCAMQQTWVEGRGLRNASGGKPAWTDDPIQA
jgi:hypothetical protein